LTFLRQWRTQSFMLTAVVEAQSYLSKAEKIMSRFEMDSVVDTISVNPTAGDIIKGTGGLRKMRIPLQGRGKRGGGRVIYWFHNEGYPAVLMWAFAKNEAADLTSAQSKTLSTVAATFIEELK
jgi:hypothetical protein